MICKRVVAMLMIGSAFAASCSSNARLGGAAVSTSRVVPSLAVMVPAVVAGPTTLEDASSEGSAIGPTIVGPTTPTPGSANTEPQGATNGSSSGTVTGEPTSLPVWSPPANALALPQVDGPDVVGVAASGFPDTVVYYPALAGTGRGHYRYIVPPLAMAAGLDPVQMDRVVSNAQIDASVALSSVPRPVLLLTPGWRSVIALSTSLAEDLASHGYIVLATQTDVAAEWSHPKSTSDDRNKRLRTIDQELDFLSGPALAARVGPIDLRRVAVGGHSYAGTIAFDASPGDDRIAAAVDLDGSARGEAVRAPTTRPTLVLVTVDAGKVSDPVLGEYAAKSPHVVSVGVIDALHMDITDAAVIPGELGTSVFSSLIGAVGPVGTTDASTIVVRYLDSVLGAPPHQPTAGALVRSLPSTTADPFGPQS